MSTESATTPEKESNYSNFWSSLAADNRRDYAARNVFPPWTKEITVSRFLGPLESEKKAFDGFKDELSSDNIIEYLNNLSEAVGKEQSINSRIVFLRTESSVPDWHLTGFKCRPAFVAIKIAPGVERPSSVAIKRSATDNRQPKKVGELAWSQLEATGEIYSGGSSCRQAMNRGAFYTGELLKARPDLVLVLGIIFHPKMSHFCVYLTDAWGVRHTEPIEFNSQNALLVLGGWIHRLYNPERRFDIKRVGSFPTKPTFTIDVESHGIFRNCILLYAGSPFYRRSAVFTTADNLVIKLQYVEKAGRFQQGPILRRIHEHGDFPGIVRLAPVSADKQGPVTVEVNVTEQAVASGGTISSEISITKSPKSVEWPQNRCAKGMREELLVLGDKAGPLVEAETPLEALIAFYDLLEVTRFLFEYRKILHRDISVGNVLLREKDWVSKTPFGDEFERMCFATHLLGEKGPDAKASRLYTRVLLIDFDMAEDRGTGSGEPSSDRSGTSIFMARLVRNPMVQENIYNLRAMPQFTTEFALESYKACVGDRVTEFSQNDKGFHEIKMDKKVPYSHRLSYDAESILWLLFWWVVQIQPLRKEPESLIPATLWMALTGGQGADDPRKSVVSHFPVNCCHPVYQDLEWLLRPLLRQLTGYQEQIAQPSDEQDPSRKKDDYLSEAFQRTILDFIVKNSDGPFMREKISPTRRPREREGEMSRLSITSPVYTSGAKRDREAMEGREEQLSGGPAAKKIKVDIPTN